MHGYRMYLLCECFTSTKCLKRKTWLKIHFHIGVTCLMLFFSYVGPDSLQLEDGQAVQLEDGTTAYIHTPKGKGGKVSVLKLDESLSATNGQVRSEYRTENNIVDVYCILHSVFSFKVF